MIRVVLIDDHVLLRGGIRTILESDGDIEVVAEAEDGAAGVELVLRHHPDVVLMDVRMPRLDGIEATRRLATARSRARALVVTTFDHDEYVVQALKAGRPASCSRIRRPTGSPPRSARWRRATRCSRRRPRGG